MRYAIFYILILTLLAGQGCVRNPETMTAPTLGRQTILADSFLAELVRQQEEIFERTYKHADLEIVYLSEADMFRRFLDDTITTIIATRPLTDAERAHLAQRQSNPREFPFATSAIAFVSGKASADTAYTYEAMLDMMRDPGSGHVFVIEDARSGLGAEVRRLLDIDPLPTHFYALDNKAAVLEYLDQHETSIGIIDYSEISDSDDPFTRQVLEQYQLLAISRPVDSLQAGFVRPFQYNLQDRKYPFTRDLYFISRSGKSDVGIGFASFITGEIGQKIILKAGLLPKYQSERIIELSPIQDIKVIR